MATAAQPILDELDTALNQANGILAPDGATPNCRSVCWQCRVYAGDQVALFDDVICRLMRDMDRTSLAELSRKIAPAGNAPMNVLASLARHADIAVSGPVIELAKALPDRDLVEIADNSKTDVKILLKIPTRAELSDAVTDALLKRGNAAVQRNLIDNPNARMSETGFAKLVMAINGDKNLAAAIAARQDVPAIPASKMHGERRSSRLVSRAQVQGASIMRALSRRAAIAAALAATTTGVILMSELADAQPVMTTPSGLKVIDLKVGTGPSPHTGQTCVMHYTGWLYEAGKKGAKFDSSVDRGKPFEFPIGMHQVIAGWDEGVATMKVGGKRTLIIPPALGYGERGAGGVIPPNATLIFDVELLGIK